MHPRPQLPGVSARGRDSLHSFRVFSLARVSTTGNATPAAWRRGGGSRTARARRCRVRGRKVRPARKVRFRSAAERSRSLRSRQSAAAGGTRPRRPAASSGAGIALTRTIYVTSASPSESAEKIGKTAGEQATEARYGLGRGVVVIDHYRE